MHSALLLGALAAFMPSAEAAPKAREDIRRAGRAENANPLGSWASALRPRGIRGRPIYGYGYGNATNTTIVQTSTVAPTAIVTYPHDGSTSVVELPPGVTDCPAEPWRSTTTVEVTVYITEGSDLEPSSEEPLPPPPTDKTKTWTLTPDPQPPYGNDSSTTPCPEDEQTAPVYPPVADLTTETAYTKPYPTESSDCDNSTVPIETVIKSYEYPPPPAETSALEEPSSETPRFPVPVTSSHFWNATTTGVYDEAPTPPVEGSNGYQEYAVYRPAVVAPEDCIIDTEIVPVSTATLTVLPSDKTEVPTKTVSENDAPTGTPEEHNAHCGVHGEPVGNYFLAQFVENTPGEPVTLEGCYQFCDSVMEATSGCQSYRFYPERGINAARCDLYGRPVASALRSIEDRHPDMWFDLSCGSPRSERWADLPGIEALESMGLE